MTTVAVVGGGVMGSATAWQLARRGVDVTVHEQFEPGHARGSSHGGTRIFRYAYDDPEYVLLAKAAYEGWRLLEADAAEHLLEVTGAVDHGSDEAVERLSAAMHSIGVTHEVMPASDAASRFPGMRFDGRVLFHPDGGRCRADATVAALHRLVPVRYGERIERIEDLDADVVVVAAGAWVAKLLPDLGLPPLTVTREQVVHFRPRDGSELDWPSFIHWHDGAAYGLPTPGEGVKVAEHHLGPVVDPDTRTFDLDDAGIDRVVDYVRAWLPGLDPTPVHPATCLYTSTPNEDFVLDRVGDVVVVSPCSGHGFKFAPEIGRLAADLALGADPVHERFTLAAHARAATRSTHR